MSNANKVLGVETGDISEINEIDSGTIVKIGATGINFDRVPLGLIIPFNDTSIPNGWSRFSSADNRMIVGAGSSYNPGNTGGSTSLSITSQTLSTAGSHQGSGTWDVPKPGTYLWTGAATDTYNFGGDHSHTIASGSGSYTPLYNNIVLIKCTQEQSEFPVNSILLSNNGQIGSLTNVHNNSRFLRCNSSIGTGGSNTVSFSCPFSSAGIHQHHSGDQEMTYHSYGNPNAWMWDIGAHSGTANLSLTISENIKRVQLSAWSNAAAAIEISPNIIGMYESLTPPEGWLLCNGNNGTPDLRNSFVKTVSGGSESSSSGNNTVTASGSGSSSHNYSHSHSRGTSNPNRDWWGALHTTWSWSHSHGYSINQSGISYLPPYYALSFIMKAA